MTIQIAEATGTATATGGRLRLRIIDAGTGSSGIYSPRVLQEAAPLFPAGTHIHLDHPTAAEAGDPRQARTLIGTLSTAATWDDTTQALEAEARIYSHYAAMLAEMAPDVGVSIHGTASSTDTPTGRVIDRIVSIGSVDIVAKAGRGGKILEVLESARAIEAMTGDDRDRIRAALAAALPDTYPHLLDFDPAAGLAVYERDGQLWRAAYRHNDGGDTTVDVATAVQVVKRISYVPVGEINQPEEKRMPEIDEARLAELTAAETRLAEAEQELTESRARNGELERERSIAEALAGIDRPVAFKGRIAASLKAVEGELTNAAIEAAVQAEDEYLAAIAPASESVTGFGPSTGGTGRKRTTNAWGTKIEGN